MKRFWKTIKVVVPLACAVAGAVFMYVGIRKGAEADRYKEDLYVRLRGEMSEELVLTRRELKEFYGREMSVLREYGIKARDVERLVNVEYRYIDTLVYRDTLVYDTVEVPARGYFEVEGKCHRICGSVSGDVVEIDGIETYDSVLVGVYRQRRGCLFGRRLYKAIAVSACSGDTLGVVDNIKVERWTRR